MPADWRPLFLPFHGYVSFGFRSLAQENAEFSDQEPEPSDMKAPKDCILYCRTVEKQRTRLPAQGGGGGFDPERAGCTDEFAARTQ